MTSSSPQSARRFAWIAFVALLVAAAWLAPVEDAARRQVDTGLQRALASFASARALNAIISAAQGTEVAVQPAGVGVVFAPGQVLDPINDLVERFSDLMLIASVSFGVQKVLIAIGANWTVPALLTLVAVAWLLLRLRGGEPWPWLTRLLVLAVMVRFAVPLAAIGSEQLFAHFMEAEYVASQEAIDTTSTTLGTLEPASVPQQGAGVIDRMRGWWAQNGDVKLRFEQLKQAAERATENIVRLIAIFLLQTLVLPLLLLWALYSVARHAFRPAAR